jgi:hypothetical protein
MPVSCDHRLKKKSVEMLISLQYHPMFLPKERFVYAPESSLTTYLLFEMFTSGCIVDFEGTDRPQTAFEI